MKEVIEENEKKKVEAEKIETPNTNKSVPEKGILEFLKSAGIDNLDVIK